MALAAFLLTLSCTMAPAQPGIQPHDECDLVELQRFDNASLEEIENCATMADALLLMNRFGSRCEVVPQSSAGETPDLSVLDEAGKALSSNEPTTLKNRVRYSGNLIQRIYDQPHYSF